MNNIGTNKAKGKQIREPTRPVIITKSLQYFSIGDLCFVPEMECGFFIDSNR